jgi:nucleoside-diphosphate-sugar epimerase
MTKRSILLTGATGYIAGLLLPALRERYDVRLTDARSTDRQGQPVEGVIVADLLAAPAAELAPLVAGVDTIVHCAYHRPAGDDIQSQYDGERRTSTASRATIPAGAATALSRHCVSSSS